MLLVASIVNLLVAIEESRKRGIYARGKCSSDHGGLFSCCYHSKHLFWCFLDPKKFSEVVIDSDDENPNYPNSVHCPTALLESAMSDVPQIDPGELIRTSSATAADSRLSRSLGSLSKRDW